jgi:hypothetical protein
VVIKISHDIPESLLTDMKTASRLGFQKKEGNSLYFSPQEGTEVSDIIGYLSGHDVKIEEAMKKEASLEEMYSAILKEVEPA